MDSNTKIEIQNEDIDWVENLFSDVHFDETRRDIIKNLDSIDIQACPGSGKTTVLVAKLAIMAKNWNNPYRGICVLSHTNVAREEIQKRLGKLSVGKQLLNYPHFIGTFQSFIDTFISIPFLKSFGYPVSIIDTSYVTYRRWNAIKNRGWLDKNANQYSCNPSEWIYPKSEKEELVFDVKCDKDTKSYKELIRVTKESHERGEFTFEEMTLFALLCINKWPSIKNQIAHRFPYLLIDEAQDTDKSKWDIVSAIYDNTSNNAIYQAYGDANQAIFSSFDSAELLEGFPREGSLNMINSKRFSNSIAAHANMVALNRCVMFGDYEKETDAQNSIILFKDGSEKEVLDRYAELILSSFSDSLLEKYDDLGCHVLAMVHSRANSEKEQCEHATRLSNYYPSYNPDTIKETPQYLIEYFRKGRQILLDTDENGFNIDLISQGIYKLLKICANNKIKTSHKKSVIALENMFDMENKFKFRKGLLDISIMPITSDTEWKSVLSKIILLFEGVIDLRNCLNHEFVSWHDWNTYSAEGQEPTHSKFRDNNYVYTNSEGREVVLKLGSIHSSKGRTHLATLILETKYYEHNIKSILPFFIGEKGSLGIRNKKRLKCQYVAMTRAKELVCLALPDSSVSITDRKKLESAGWRIVEI